MHVIVPKIAAMKIISCWRKRSTILFMVFFFVLTAWHLPNHHNPGNQELPDVTITNLDGEKTDIRQFGKNDKITVISFWATWCKPCKKELSNLSNLYPEWKDKYNVEIVAVSTDDSRNRSNVVTYVNGQAWDFEVLLDSNQKLKRALNFQAIPYTVLLDKNGKIAYTHKGYVSGDEYVLEDKIKQLVNK